MGHQAGVLEPPAHLVLVGDLAPVPALVGEDDGDHRHHHSQPGAVVDMTGPTSPDTLGLADPRVMSVDINSLLDLGLSVPHYGVEVTTLVNLHLEQHEAMRHEGGHRVWTTLQVKSTPTPTAAVTLVGGLWWM